jgi:hypothetical protein
VTDSDIDSLLAALDAKAREHVYPPQGLPIWGEWNEREAYRQIVRDWLARVSPEAQR